VSEVDRAHSWIGFHTAPSVPTPTPPVLEPHELWMMIPEISEDQGEAIVDALVSTPELGLDAGHIDAVRDTEGPQTSTCRFTYLSTLVPEIHGMQSLDEVAEKIVLLCWAVLGEYRRVVLHISPKQKSICARYEERDYNRLLLKYRKHKG
jgi:hypothetical protein